MFISHDIPVNEDEPIIVTRIKKNCTDDPKQFPCSPDGYNRAMQFIRKEASAGRMWILSMMTLGCKRS